MSTPFPQPVNKRTLTMTRGRRAVVHEYDTQVPAHVIEDGARFTLYVAGATAGDYSSLGQANEALGIVLARRGESGEG